MSAHVVQLDDEEIKMLLVAIRQVRHTFEIAEAQSREAGEQLTDAYDGVRDAYEQLHEKLARITGEGDAGRSKVLEFK